MYLPETLPIMLRHSQRKGNLQETFSLQPISVFMNSSLSIFKSQWASNYQHFNLII